MRLEFLLHDERGQAFFESFRSREDAGPLRLRRATRAADCVSSEAQKLKPSDFLCSTAPFEISSWGGFFLMLGTIPAPVPFSQTRPQEVPTKSQRIRISCRPVRTTGLSLGKHHGVWSSGMETTASFSLWRITSNRPESQSAFSASRHAVKLPCVGSILFPAIHWHDAPISARVRLGTPSRTSLRTSTQQTFTGRQS